MMAGLVLILLAFILILVGVLLVFQILPRFIFTARAPKVDADGSIEIETRTDPGIAQVPPAVRNGVLGFCGVVSLILVISGVVLIFQDQSHDWELRSALIRNQERLAQLAQTPSATLPSQTPTATATIGGVTATPGSVTPTATRTPSTNGGKGSFNLAVQLDQDGKNVQAIETYKAALDGGLDATAKQAAELEIGLLSLLQVREGDLHACNDALLYLKPLSTTATDKATRSSATDGYKLADDLCP